MLRGLNTSTARAATSSGGANRGSRLSSSRRKYGRKPTDEAPFKQPNQLVWGPRAEGEYVREDVRREFREKSLKGEPMSKAAADEYAEGLMRWAVTNGAEQYTHWWHPIGFNHRVGELHRGFDHTSACGEKRFLNFDGASLFSGETDGSSFPNGGLRVTSRAGGYLSFDPASRPFIRNEVLYLSSVFNSWEGLALDERTPLLRAGDALSREGSRLAKCEGIETSHIVTNLGCEQEYFLIDRAHFEQRLDLRYTGRTLFGSASARSQLLDDHYMKSINHRVSHFMREITGEILDIGINVTTNHTEVAPGQFEHAPSFTEVTNAADQNLAWMRIMEEVAERHDLAVLFHEKPFSGINGSGKHNNVSYHLDNGHNLFSAGKTEAEQRLFMLFLAAQIKALHVHGDLYRMSVATPGNDFRLGACEAPPGIISTYLGEALTTHVDNVINGGPLTGFQETKESRSVNASRIQPLLVPTEDRNRTSPFPYGGKRFEFRAVGSTQTVGYVHSLLSSAMADACREMADTIEARVAKGENARDAVEAVIRDTFKQHRAVIFNGDNYTQEWAEEAERRGLANVNNGADALAKMDDPKNVELFGRLGVMNEREVHARKEVYLEQYALTIEIEADVACQMVRSQVMPVVRKEIGANHDVLRTGLDERSSGLGIKKNIDELFHLLEALATEVHQCEELLANQRSTDPVERSVYARDQLRPCYERMRQHCDRLEQLVSLEQWPMPTYQELVHNL